MFALHHPYYTFRYIIMDWFIYFILHNAGYLQEVGTLGHSVTLGLVLATCY